MRIVFKKLGSWGLSCGLLLTALLFAGCQFGGSSSQFAEWPNGTEAPVVGSSAPAGQTGNQPVSAPAQGRTIDTIQIGDALTITFSDLPQPVLPIEDRVKEDGTITLLQNQQFVAAGKTRGQLEKEIRDRYVPRFYVTMTVNVRPQQNTQFYFVGGEVRSPGRLVYTGTGTLTVTKAIQSAGDFTDFANRRKVKLYRISGKIETINCKKALENPSLDLEVLPGDKIHVPRSIF